MVSEYRTLNIKQDNIINMVLYISLGNKITTKTGRRHNNNKYYIGLIVTHCVSVFKPSACDLCSQCYQICIH